MTILTPGPTRIMGIVNVGTDSFSIPEPVSMSAAIALGLQLADDGADIIDVGGESTRPGSARVSEEDELARVIPVIAALCEVGLTVSVDTVRSRVAAAAIDAGARLVNDVSGGLSDPEILDVVAGERVAYVLQHWQKPFDHGMFHERVVDEVIVELSERAEAAVARGIDRDRVILDPGLGFGKGPADNWALIAHADRIAALGYPVLWGASRKRFLAQMYDEPTEPWQRDAAGVALTAILACQGVWGVRVHTVVDHLRALRVGEAVRSHG